MPFRMRPLLLRTNWRGRTTNRACACCYATAFLTPQELEVHPQYPLSWRVREKLNPTIQYKPGPGRNVGRIARKVIPHLRTQIVSPDICDDTLKYIASSLEKHKGCDILDLNPGAGLWSQKVHDFLKPRSHILIEPQMDKFDEFLRPLLDMPGSTYKLVQKDPTSFETYDELIKDGVLPHQKPVLPGEKAAQEPNNSLLIIGSLIWDPKLPGFAFDSIAKQLLFQFPNMAWQNKLFHSFGLARMLLWLQHDDLKGSLPRSELHVGKASFTLQKLARLAEVVTAQHTHRKAGRNTVGREPRYELQSILGAMKRGRENGMELPQHRRENVHDFAEHVDRVSNGTGIIGTEELSQYLMEQEKSGKSTIGLVTTGVIESYQKDRTKNKNVAISDEVERSVRRDNNLKRGATGQYNRDKIQKEKAVDLGELVYDLECRIMKMPEGGLKQEALEQLESLNKDFEEVVEKIAQIKRSQIISDLDDRIQLKTPVVRLQWDARPYEPLVMSPEEVWPANRVSLIDVVPEPIPKGQNSEFYECWSDFMSALFRSPVLPVTSALENMAHGMSELVDRCPSLRDPAKGGRLQLENLRVRMLTTAMVDELVKAYIDWPFRAPDYHAKYFRFKAGIISLGD